MPEVDMRIAVPDDHVVVAGFGPVGAVAALALARRGTPVVVLESDPALRTDPAESRASTFHPPTLELLEELGVVDELEATGLRAGKYQRRDRNEGVIAEFDLAMLADVTRFPYRLQSEQQNLVSIIERHLSRIEHASVRFGTPLESVEIVGDRCLIHVGGDQPHTLDARWVIAADGSNSTVRRILDVDFPGLTYPERFLVVSTTFPMHEALPDIAPVNYVADSEEWYVLLRTPRHWRVLFPVPDDLDERTILAPQAVQERLQRIVPLTEFPISHTTLHRVHQRVAESFRAGPVLLAGDAAHINNPIGGMGMNSGIQDAVAAARAVTAAMDGDGQALDSYARERHRAAIGFVQRATHGNWQQLQERDPKVRARNNDRLRRVAADPDQARQFLLVSSMLLTDSDSATGSPVTASSAVGQQHESSEPRGQMEARGARRA